MTAAPPPINTPRAADEAARCWAEIDLGAIVHNAAVARHAAGPGAVALMAVVKADAYGHGVGPVALALRAAGVERFAVANVREAAVLQDLFADDPRPITVLSPALPAERAEIIRRGLRPWISGADEARDYARLLRGPPGAAVPGFGVEVEIDTGMGRAGIPAADWPALRDTLRTTLPDLPVLGWATHLPSPDEDAAWTRGQLARFADLVADPAAAGPPPEALHAQNSAGLLGYARPAGADVVRPGLMLYGASPLPACQPRLRPALTLKTRVLLVRTLPPGHGVSYGRTFVTDRPTRVATLAAGYADGYPRRLSNAGAAVLLRGRRCPVLGRVTMDMILADVGGLEDGGRSPVEPGEETVLLGRQGTQEIPAGELADRAGTIPWEIFTNLKPRGGRVYLEG